MKRQIIILTALLFILIGGFYSCKKPEQTNIDGTWICSLKSCITSEPNIVITLNIDSKQKQVYVNTSYQDTAFCATFHRFRNGEQYILCGDTLYFSVLHELQGPAFAITRVSSKSLKLTYLQMLPMYPPYIGEYMFNLKTK